MKNKDISLKIGYATFYLNTMKSYFQSFIPANLNDKILFSVFLKEISDNIQYKCHEVFLCNKVRGIKPDIDEKESHFKTEVLVFII